MSDRFENHLKTMCPKCGIEQDPDEPTCIHMVGKKGGRVASAKQDMRALGKMGGDAVKAKRGLGFYQEIGRKGGQAVRDKKGPEFYRVIGEMGGQALKKAAPPGHFEAIGTKGGQRTKDLCKAGKCALKKGGDDD